MCNGPEPLNFFVVLQIAESPGPASSEEERPPTNSAQAMDVTGRDRHGSLVRLRPLRG